MENKNEFKPYIPAEKVTPELTITSIVMGILLAVIFGAANAYLGLRVGMTVSASIPAAVISMGVIRVIMKKNSIFVFTKEIGNFKILIIGHFYSFACFKVFSYSLMHKLEYLSIITLKTGVTEEFFSDCIRGMNYSLTLIKGIIYSLKLFGVMALTRTRNTT